MDQELGSFLEEMLTEMQHSVTDSGSFSGKIMVTVLLGLLFLLCQWGLKKIFIRSAKDMKRDRVFYLILHNVLRAVLVVAILIVWFNALDSFLLIVMGFLLLASLSIKNLIINLAGWFFIVSRHHFRIYDRIEVDGIKGEVIEIKPMFFTVMELANWFDAESPTGRTVKLPNKLIFEEAIYNYTERTHFVWNEIQYTLTYESDIDRALAIMADVAQRYTAGLKTTTFSEPVDFARESAQFPLFDGNPQPVTLVASDPLGVIVKVRYMVFYKDGSTVRTQLEQEIIQAFQKESAIQLALDQLRIRK